MKSAIGVLLFLSVSSLYSQIYNTTYFDSLHRINQNVLNERDKINLFSELANYHKFIRPDSGIFYATQAIALARSIAWNEGELRPYGLLAMCYRVLGDINKSQRIAFKGLKKVNQHGFAEAQLLLNIGQNHLLLGDFESAKLISKRSAELLDSLKEFDMLAIQYANLSEVYIALGQTDSALAVCYKSKALAESINKDWVYANVFYELGRIHFKTGNLDSALYYLKKSYPLSGVSDAGRSLRGLELAKVFQAAGTIDSAIYYTHEAIRAGSRAKLFGDLVNTYLFMSSLMEKRDVFSGFQYYKLAFAYKDSLAQLATMSAYKDFIDFDLQEKESELRMAQNEYQNRMRTNASLGSALTLFVIAIFLFWNNRIKHRSNIKIEKAYHELKSTQAQLIQSEKMASLGELTAGIAHEIQNPLNFVNNFSDVNKELAVELEQEIDKGNYTDAKAIVKDIKDNEEKINHHGKRADAIVKSMLQHSRTSSGQKEPTDINALCDEYLRLAYHGLKAKDKSFNAKFETDFDSSLPKVNVVPQDLGRVILNLLNNAFYAVNERSKKGDAEYQPIVTVTTKLMANSQLQIVVKDNGSGIPENIREKVFQPFFTTKPTGQGTGLGLSLSYDMVKAHDGEIKVETRENIGAGFYIILPL